MSVCLSTAQYEVLTNQSLGHCVYAPNIERAVSRWLCCASDCRRGDAGDRAGSASRHPYPLWCVDLVLLLQILAMALEVPSHHRAASTHVLKVLIASPERRSIAVTARGFPRAFPERRLLPRPRTQRCQSNPKILALALALAYPTEPLP